MDDERPGIGRTAAWGALATVALCSSTPATADLPTQVQICSLQSSVSECPQIDPAKGKLVSIDIDYSSSSKFVLIVTGDKHTTTDYKVVVWQELDTMGSDIGSFYITASGTIDVLPPGLSPADPPQIAVSGSFKSTETNPAKLARFVGKSVVPIAPIAEPATGADKQPTLGYGTIQSFYRLSSSVTGSLRLNYQPVLKKPVIKLPPQHVPQPFKVPPYPKAE